MSKTYLTMVCNGTWNTECLKSLSDCCCCVCCSCASLLDRDSCTYNVCPACILKTDRLNLLNLIVNIKSSVLCDLLSFFDRADTIAVKNSVNLVNSSFV